MDVLEIGVLQPGGDGGHIEDNHTDTRGVLQYLRIYRGLQESTLFGRSDPFRYYI